MFYEFSYRLFKFFYSKGQFSQSRFKSTFHIEQDRLGASSEGDSSTSPSVEKSLISTAVQGADLFNFYYFDSVGVEFDNFSYILV